MILNGFFVAAEFSLVKVRIEDYEVTVTETDGRRVSVMKFEKRNSEDEFPPDLRRQVKELQEGESS